MLFRFQFRFKFIKHVLKVQCMLAYHKMFLSWIPHTCFQTITMRFQIREISMYNEKTQTTKYCEEYFTNNLPQLIAHVFYYSCILTRVYGNKTYLYIFERGKPIHMSCTTLYLQCRAFFSPLPTALS